MKSNGRNGKFGVSLVLMALMAACSPDTPSGAKKTDAPAQVIMAFQASLPATLTPLAAKEDGACNLDAINDAPFVNKTGEFKSGVISRFTGWAVANPKAGKVGSAVWIELRGVKSFYSEAAFYQRPGLGKALGAEVLDGGGVVLRDVALPTEPGRYEVIYLVQADNVLVRCNTGNTLSIK